MSGEGLRKKNLKEEEKQKYFLRIMSLFTRCHVMRVIPQEFSAAFAAFCMPAHGGFAAFYFPELPLRIIERSPDIVNVV